MSRKLGACLICGESLEYLKEGTIMKCSLCNKLYRSKARCKKGHFVCDRCHSLKGIDIIREVCSSSESRNPIEIMNAIMENPYIYMHGPEHHILVGCALLAAYKNSGGDIDLNKALEEMVSRGSEVPGGACGFWGSCGAGISTGIFISLITGTTPLSTDSYGLANLMTSKSLLAIGKVGGPRCCKRNSYLSALTASNYVKEQFNIRMELPHNISCSFTNENKQCIGKKCPFNHSLRE